MMWQDLVFMVGTFALALMLLPTLLDTDAAVPRTTSLPTAVVVSAFVVAFASMGMWLAAAGNVLSVLFWLVIAAKRAP